MQFVGGTQIAPEMIKTCWNLSEVQEIIRLTTNEAIKAEYAIGIIMLIIGIVIGWQCGIRKR